jgi:membrane-bound ClpP family serine protease
MVIVGVALVLVGVTLLVAEAHLPAGILGVAGAVTLVGGAAVAFSAAGGGLALVLAATIAAAAVVGLWLAVATRKALASQRRRTSSGREALSGRLAVVRNWTDTGGQVFVDGALWRARRSWADDADELVEGDSVVVEQVRGLTLAVRRAEDWEDPC